MSLNDLQNLIEDAVNNENFSAISIAVSGSKKLNLSYGWTDLNKQTPIKEGFFFDLASITKTILATKFFELFSHKNLNPDLKLIDFYKQHGLKIDKELGEKRIYHLLTHRSGLKAWLPLYEKLKSKKEYYDYIRENFPYSENINIYEVEYSDLGYILLGEILELYHQDPLNFIIETFLRQIDIEEMFYLPLETGLAQDFIVSTANSNMRKKIPQGIVNDDNAFVMGGVSGHAGLFGNINAMSQFGDFILDTYKNGTSIINENIFKEMISVKDLKTGWSAGWVYPTKNSQGGTLLSQNSIGTLGFTGTSLWIDLDKEFTISLLANRTISEKAITHSSMQDEFKKLRPKIMDLVLSL